MVLVIFCICFVGLSLESVEKVVRNFMYIKNVLLHTLAKRLSEHGEVIEHGEVPGKAVQRVRARASYNTSLYNNVVTGLQSRRWTHKTPCNNSDRPGKSSTAKLAHRTTSSPKGNIREQHVV